MKNKVIFIIIAIVLILVIGFFIFKTKPNEESNTLNMSNGQNIENSNSAENVNTSSNMQNVQNTSATVNGTENQTSEENDNNLTVKQEASPNGFMGSSLYKVVLYSNNEAYLLTYDGNGYDNQNIVSRTLIAKNVDSINVSQDEMHLGEVIIKGGTPVNQDMGWIVFE